MPSIFRNYLWVPWRCHPSFAPTSLISWVPLRALSPLCILLGLFSLYCLHFLPKRVLTYHNFNYYQCAYAIEVSKISNQTFLVNSKHIYQASYLAVFMEHLTYISKLIISANKLPRLFSSWLNRTSKCWVVQARSRGGSVLPSPTSPSPTSTKSCRLLLFWSVRGIVLLHNSLFRPNQQHVSLNYSLISPLLCFLQVTFHTAGRMIICKCESSPAFFLNPFTNSSLHLQSSSNSFLYSTNPSMIRCPLPSRLAGLTLSHLLFLSLLDLLILVLPEKLLYRCYSQLLTCSSWRTCMLAISLSLNVIQMLPPQKSLPWLSHIK